MALSKNILYYGKEALLPEQTKLRAGPLTLVYEAGDLRYVKLGGQEIVRRIYVAIRDPNWNTIEPALTNIQMGLNSDSFRITYEVENKQGDIDFYWRGVITGDSQGSLSFSMDGEARSTFQRNRIGFCILYPMGIAGVPARIEHVGGQIEASPFPVNISPQLVIDGIVNPVHPFSEMQGLSYQLRPDLWAETRFAGDIFEMEDQRNWTDASYKVYSTPLRLTFPVELKEGTQISQSVTLALRGEIPEVPAGAAGEDLSFAIGSAPARPLPRLGLGLAGHGQPLSQKELDRLKALHLAHLRVDVKLWQPDYESILRQAAAEANALGASLEVAVHLSDDAEVELKALAVLLKAVKPPVRAWLIFHRTEKSTGETWINLAREYLAGYDPAAKIGSGTNVFFTELNRNKPPVHSLDLVTYSLNPQVHAFDNASLTETLEAQAVTVASARQFIGALPLAISPITFKMRFNPNATGPEPDPAPGELPPQVDERQMSLFGAGWTVGSLKYLSESDTQSLTYYETTGWRGVMETESGSPIPEKFQSMPGAVFPLYHVLADYGEFAGGEIIPTTSSHPLQIDGLAMHKAGKTRVLLANLSPETRQVTVQNLAERMRLRFLDETNAEVAMRSPEEFRAQAGEERPTSNGSLSITLRPYAVVRIDSQRGNQA